MKISFVIPSHNTAGWLHPAIDSCFKQTYKDIEIIVVNDGSTDSTGKYLEWLNKNEPKVTIITLPKKEGRSVARNLGNDAATGNVICVLDADDICAPKRAEIVAGIFEKGTQFLYGSAALMNAVGEKLGEELADTFNKDKALETFQNRIVHSTVAYTKDIAKKFQYQAGEISDLGIDDWAQQISIALSGIKLDFTPNVLSAYRMLSTGISKTRDNARVLEVKKRHLESLKVA